MFSPVYRVYDAFETNSFCASTPEDIASSFPRGGWFGLAFDSYRQGVEDYWHKYCECKQCEPPPFKGGQCPIFYNIQYRTRNNPEQIRGTAGQAALMGPIVSIKVEERRFWSQPEWAVIMRNSQGQELRSHVYQFNGDPFDLRAVKARPEDKDECGDPSPTTPPPPRPPRTPPSVITPPPLITPPPPPKLCLCPPPKIIEKEKIVYRDRVIKTPCPPPPKEKERPPVICNCPPVIRFPTPANCVCPPPPKQQECPPPESINVPIFDKCEDGKPRFRTLSLTVPKGAGQSIQQTFRTIANNYKCEDDVKFVNLSVKLFDRCNNGLPQFRNESIRVIQGLELQTQKQFEEIAQIRAQDCRLGLTQFPVEVPRTLLAYSDGQLETVKNPLELFTWFIKQFDALIGNFPIEIEIEDADPTQAGSQTRKIELPNISEALAEMYGLAITGSTNSDVAINMLMRLAAEVIGVKNSSLITQDYVRANASYLGYKGNPKRREVNYSFDPTKLDTLDQLLKESKGYLQGWEEDDKNSVAEYLQKLMFASGVIKAAFFRDSKLLEQMRKEVEDLATGGTSKDNQEWETFIQKLNDPQSEFNKNTDNPQPRIKETPFTLENNGDTV